MRSVILGGLSATPSWRAFSCSVEWRAIRTLAAIDGLLIQAEEIAEDPFMGELRDDALDYLIEFQDAKHRVERMVGGDK